MELILVRHGETLENQLNTLWGQIDTELTLLGRRQAKAVSKRLQFQNLDAIYSSDLQRARGTAEYIIVNHNLSPIYDNLIREKHGGLLQGHPKGILEQQALEKRQSVREFRPEKGESWLDVQKRAKKFMNYVLESHFDESCELIPTVLAVTHRGFITEMDNVIRKMSKKPQLLLGGVTPNWSVTVYRFATQRGKIQGRKILSNDITGSR